MNLRIQNQVQSDIDPSANSKGANVQAASGYSQSDTSNVNALNIGQDTASISGATKQLSDDVAIRQDRVDALRIQVESGTYTVNSRAVATAMFQNLFRN